MTRRRNSVTQSSPGLEAPPSALPPSLPTLPSMANKLIHRLQKLARSKPNSSLPLKLHGFTLVHYQRVNRSITEASSRFRDRADQPSAPLPGRTPKGFLPVLVGTEARPYLVKASHLNHPLLSELLERSADKYGYSQKGILRMACEPELFEQILCVVRSDSVLRFDTGLGVAVYDESASSSTPEKPQRRDLGRAFKCTAVAIRKSLARKLLA